MLGDLTYFFCIFMTGDGYVSHAGHESEKAVTLGRCLYVRCRHMHELVRTILSVNEKEKSMTFAGDIPEGYIVTLMRGNFGNLVEGAAIAVGYATPMSDTPWQLAILISCIG